MTYYETTITTYAEYLSNSDVGARLLLPRVKVVLVGYLASLTGRREIDIDIAYEVTLDDLIRELISVAGESLRKHLIDPSSGNLLPPPPLILVNGRIVTKPLKSVGLLNGDNVTLLPPVGGGKHQAYHSSRWNYQSI